MIGTGPFKFVEHRPGEYYLLQRNEDYWGEGLPYLDEIVFQVLPDRAAAGNALEAEEIQLAAFSAVPLADLERISQGAGHQGLCERLRGAHLPARRGDQPPPQGACRRARAPRHRACDRPRFRREHDLPRLRQGGDRAGAGLRHDVLRAGRAEIRLRSGGGERAARRGRLSARRRTARASACGCCRRRSSTRRSSSATICAQALAEIGIDAEIVSNDTPAHLKAVYTDHDFDITVGPPVYRGDPAISTTVLFQSGLPAGVPFSNQYGYANPAVDELIAKGAAEIDDAKRVAIYKEFQKAVVGRRGADQRGGVQLHHGRPRQRAERLQQSALGGLVLGRHLGAARRRPRRAAGGGLRGRARRWASARLRTLRLLRRRLIGAVPVLLIVAVGAFLLLEAAPGDAVDAYLAGTGGGDAELDRAAARRMGPRPGAAAALRRLHGRRSLHARSRLVDGLQPAGARRRAGAAAEHAAPDVAVHRLRLRGRLGARHRRRRAAGQRARPAALDRLDRRLCHARLLARPRADRDLRRRSPLAAERRHRDPSPPARPGSTARSTSRGTSSCRSPRSASSIWRSTCG